MDFLRGLSRRVHGHFLPTKHNAYRPRLLHTSWLFFFLAFILTAEGVFLTNAFANQSARDFLAAVLPSEIVELTNLERGFNNVPTLKESAVLTKAAQAKAKDMAANGYFAHVGPDGKEPWQWLKESGYTYRAAGENLAVRFAESADVVDAWMASPTHRANIVKQNYTEIGVATAQGKYKGATATFVVQYFGRPASTSAFTSSTQVAVAEMSPQVLGAAAEDVAKIDAAELVAGVGMAPTVQAYAVLAAVAVFLVFVLILTFVVNIQVQPVDLLLGGGGVAALAIGLVALNTVFFGPTLETAQTASLIHATEEQVYIGEGASVEELETSDAGIEALPPEASQSTLTI